MKDYPTDVLWNRRDEDAGETPLQFKYFLLWRELGEKRSFKKLAAMTGRSLSNLHNLSSQFKWRVRIAAFSDWQAIQMTEKRRRLNERTAHREAVVSAKLSSFLVSQVNKLIALDEKDSSFVMQPAALGQLFEAAARIARVGRGEPADRLASTTNVDLAAELMSALKSLKEKKAQE